MIRVQIDSGNPREVFRDLWVEVPNYANPKGKGTLHACFCDSPPKKHARRQKAAGHHISTYLVPRAWALKNGVCGPFPNPFVPHYRKGPAGSRYVFQGRLDADRFQDKAADGVHKSMAKRNSALLCMPCGFGKTVTTLAILAGMRSQGGRSHNRRPNMLVFAHKNFLLDQWEARARSFLSVDSSDAGGKCRPVRVGRYQGSRADCDWSEFDIICASLATVARRLADRDPTAFRLMGGGGGEEGGERGQGITRSEPLFLVVYDEAHHVPATTWLRTFFCLRARPGLHVLGLSATPRRADGLDVFLGSCFGTPFVSPVADARAAALRQRRETYAKGRLKVSFRNAGGVSVGHF